MNTRDTLPRATIDRGRKTFLWFVRVNSLSFICLAENLMILYLLKSGFSDAQAGAVAAFMFLAMPTMLLGKWLIARLGAVWTMASCWIVRSGVALVFAAVPLFTPDSPMTLRLALMGTCVFLFFSLRSIGGVSFMPIIAEISTEKTRGRLVSDNFFNSALMLLVGTIIQAFILKRYDTLMTYQWIVATGAFIGFASVILLLKTPETDTPRRSASQSVMQAFRTTWQTPVLRKLLFSWICCMVAISVVVPYTMVATKQGYQISDSAAMILSLVQIVGSIIVSMLLGFMSDRTGPRPLILFLYAVLTLICLAWAFAPDHFSWWFFVPLFLAAGAGNLGLQSILPVYLLRAVSPNDRVGVSMIVASTAGLAAGIAGSLIGGNLVHWLGGMIGEGDGPVVYRRYFDILLVGLLAMSVVVHRLESIRDLRPARVLELLFSLRDMRALWTLYRWEGHAGADRDRKFLDELGTIGSQLSEDSLLPYLESPSFAVRSRALVALRNMSLSTTARQALLRELHRGEYTTSYMAADIAGEQGLHEAIQPLREGLASDDLFLRSKCILALARLGDNASLKHMLDVLRTSNNPRLLIHAAAAVATIQCHSAIELLLLRSAEQHLPQEVRDELLYNAACLGGFDKAMYSFMTDIASGTTRHWADLVTYVPNTIFPNTTATPPNTADQSASPLPSLIERILDDYQHDRLTSQDLLEQLRQIMSRRHDADAEPWQAALEQINADLLYSRLVWCICFAALGRVEPLHESTGSI